MYVSRRRRLRRVHISVCVEPDQPETLVALPEMAHYAAAKEYLGLAPIDRIVAYVYLGQAAVDGAPEAERREPNVEWRGL